MHKEHPPIRTRTHTSLSIWDCDAGICVQCRYFGIGSGLSSVVSLLLVLNVDVSNNILLFLYWLGKPTDMDLIWICNSCLAYLSGLNGAYCKYLHFEHAI